MTPIPREPGLDSTRALLSEGYLFGSTRARRHHSDVFRTRLLLREAFVAMGEEAAREFYEPGRFTRQRAMPVTTLKLLQDKGSVQLLQGEAHRSRKRLFLSLMTDGSIQRLCGVMAEEWRRGITRWEAAGRVVLLDETREVLCRAVCRWAGIHLDRGEPVRRTREFAAMIDGAGAVGPRNWWGLVLRSRTERWCRDLIRRTRSGRLDVEEGTPLHTVAWHRGTDGALLDTAVAAVELINVLRPTVAVANFVTFAALALHDHPECRTKLRTGEVDTESFVHEVRRFYPFFPVVGGRVREPFTWRGHHFREGTWMLLDLHATNHDPRSWEQPDRFRPERFDDWDEGAFDFVPQGGGDYEAGHRCPGEWLTIALLKTAVDLLVSHTRYEVPEQDLRIDLTRIPAVPNSGFVVAGVRPDGTGSVNE